MNTNIDPVERMISAVSYLWILFFLPLVLILPRLLGITGVILLQPGADMLTFLIMIPFQIVLNRNLKRLEKAHPAA